MNQSPLEALKVVQKYCDETDNCEDCNIRKECHDIRFKQEVPARWKLGDEKE